MVRMKDIANDLGISVVTVLRALRNYPDVSAATRAEVLLRAKELNYRPNLAARALVTGHTGLMGLVIPNLVHASFAQLAVELSGVLRNQAFTLIISSTGEDPEVEQQEIDHLLSEGRGCPAGGINPVHAGGISSARSNESALRFAGLLLSRPGGKFRRRK